MRLWLLVHISRANASMKLNAPDDLLSPSLDNGLIKRFFMIFIAVVLLVDNDENRKFLFCRKTFI